MATQDIFNMTDTWNAGGTTFTAVKMNVTDTASAAASILCDFQIGGSSRFNITKDGKLHIGGGTPSLNYGVSTAATWTFENGSFFFAVNAGGPSASIYQFASFAGGTTDAALIRNSAGLVEANSGGAAGTGGIVPGMRFATTQVVTALVNNSTSAQNVFAAANDVLTLEASTTYFFECLYFINTGTTTHTTATGFVASSAFTNIAYLAELWSTTAGTISTTAPSVLDVTASTATVLNATSVAPRTTIRCRGMIRTNAASTVTPQITFSAGPTGTCEVAINSYFRIWPAGTNTVAAVGAWA